MAALLVLSVPNGSKLSVSAVSGMPGEFSACHLNFEFFQVFRFLQSQTKKHTQWYGGRWSLLSCSRCFVFVITNRLVFYTECRTMCGVLPGDEHPRKVRAGQLSGNVRSRRISSLSFCQPVESTGRRLCTRRFILELFGADSSWAGQCIDVQCNLFVDFCFAGCRWRWTNNYTRGSAQ